jgi:ATP-binding cassette subfamily B protein
MGSKQKSIDKKISREAKRLFWEALSQSKYKFFLSATGHTTYFFINGVIVPLLIAYAVQNIINRNFDVVADYALGIVGVSLFAGLIQFGAIWAFNHNGTSAVTYLSEKMFKNYLGKDYEFFGNNYIGALGSHVTTMKKALLDYQLIIGFNGPRAVVTIVASLVVIFLQSPLLALVVCVSMVANLSFVYLFSRYRLQFRREVSVASSNVAAVIGDALSHGTTVKSYASEVYEQQRLKDALIFWERAQLRSWALFTPSTFVRTMISIITIAVLLVVSARLYQDGKIPIAIVALVQLYVVRLMNTMLEIGEVIKSYDQLMGDAQQPVETMLQATSVHDPSKPMHVQGNAHTIEFQSTSYRYPDAKSDTAALKDFSLLISSGEKVGIVGYSGSGKTTLTKLLLRFMDLSGGKILINGVDLREMKQSDLRSMVSYVPQEPLLFHRSIADNISYATSSSDDEALKRAAKSAYVDEFVEELPKGYNTLVGERGVKLSGGQRQRVAIARAILKDVPILVLDEATSALDSRSEQLIQKALWKLMSGRTALVIAHRLSTIQKMDRIAVMDKGMIVQLGTHEELLKDREGIYAQLWSHQSGGYLGGVTEEE